MESEVLWCPFEHILADWNTLKSHIIAADEEEVAITGGRSGVGCSAGSRGPSQAVALTPDLDSTK